MGDEDKEYIDNCLYYFNLILLTINGNLEYYKIRNSNQIKLNEWFNYI